METGAVASITMGTVLLIVANYYIDNTAAVSDIWAVQVCAVFVVMSAAVYGMTSGIMMPVAAAIITGVSFMGMTALREMVLLLLFGIANGHYAEKFRIRRGEFTGIRIFDFCMLQTALSIVAWICVNPLAGFYIDRIDIRNFLDEGVIHCGVSILSGLCICLPLLLVSNRMFRNKRIVMDAEKEYMYTNK